MLRARSLVIVVLSVLAISLVASVALAAGDAPTPQPPLPSAR